MINGSTISWQTKKQQMVATLTTQAEYQALLTAVKEALWIRSILEELSFKQERPMIIDQDNKSTIALANHLVNHVHTKHIDIAHHFIRENIEENTIALQYCMTDDMKADIMTKILPFPKFTKCKKSINVQDMKNSQDIKNSEGTSQEKHTNDM